MKSRILLAVLGVCLLVAFAAVAGGLLLSSRKQQPPSGQVARVTAATQQYGTAPRYQLTDQNGRRFSSEALHGKIQVVSYLFPYCTSYCPIIGRNLARVEQMLPPSLKNRVEFVAFNVDPGESGPRQMSKFLSQYGISPRDPHWHYLTGSRQQIRHVVTDGFHIFYKKVTLAEEERAEKHQKAAGTFHAQPEEPNALAAKAKVNYDIVHNDAVEIVAGSGTIKTFFDSGDRAAPRQIVAAIKRAARS